MSGISNKELFLAHVAQTSQAPMGLEIVKANGCVMWDTNGRPYFDLISGFSVANIGHGNEAVITAIHQQSKDYMHLMVYGEIVERPQVAYAKRLTDHLPSQLDCVYFTNSGTEATEGAMKLAKRYTGRTEVIAFNHSYHGSTQGALSVMGDEYWRNAYRPLLPDVWHLQYNDDAVIGRLTERTACVIMETVQAEAGVIRPRKEWIQAIRQRCTETGTLLIFDEIQVGFGRTGTLWAFQQYGIVPDILMLGKALGGGMPLGAFIANKAVMHSLTHDPVLGHISTFAGHPVCCAAGMAAFDVLKQTVIGEQAATTVEPVGSIQRKEALFRSLLVHPSIKAVRSSGLLMALEFTDADTCHAIMKRCIANGLITDQFLFALNCLRVAPPLIITEEQVREVSALILRSIDEASAQ